MLWRILWHQAIMHEPQYMCPSAGNIQMLTYANLLPNILLFFLLNWDFHEGIGSHLYMTSSPPPPPLPLFNKPLPPLGIRFGLVHYPFLCGKNILILVNHDFFDSMSIVFTNHKYSQPSILEFIKLKMICFQLKP